MPDASLFTNVCQIQPAHFLIKSEFSSQPHCQSYWDFNYPKSTGLLKEISEEERILGFRELLKAIHWSALKADVPVACYLSGGLDLARFWHRAATKLKARFSIYADF